ncbi:hypothetical protein ACUWC2_28735, partial [Klebsiella pneumoniae]|uniref:hypothetical protein n=1 Tax=Klebsiella pneumoniae TaxID=573 RepID=UPI0040554A4E
YEFIENYKPDTLSVINIGKMDDSKYNMIKFINSTPTNQKKETQKNAYWLKRKKVKRKLKN